MSSISENLSRDQDAIATACRKAGRSREEVRLMAVSKTHPVELLLEAAAAGQQLFGENRVQEFVEKSQTLAATAYSVKGSTAFPVSHQSKPIEVHLIGHLQSNKAIRAAEVFSAIDTLDSLKLAERLYDTVQRLGRSLPVLLEIKLSPEKTKEGLAPDAPELHHLLERLHDFSDHLPLSGLMTVAPISDDPAVSRNCFRQLRELREQLAQQYPRLSFEDLSMGMSSDFETAIEESATTIRIGTAIFGARPKPLSKS